MIAAALASALSACGAGSDADLVRATQCVDIPDGQYFQFVDGKLMEVSTPDEQVEEHPIQTAQRIGRSLAGQGFPWLTIDWDGQTATIGGLAPSEAGRIDGFRNARAAFEKDPLVGDLVERVVNNIEIRLRNADVSGTLDAALNAIGISWLEADVKRKVVILHGMAPDSASKQEAYRAALNAISIRLNSDKTDYVAVDAISVPGQTEPVGEALLSLSEAPSLIECDNAFFETMDDQSIAFVDDQAIVSNSSKQLMDALAAVASLCDAYEIEIRQHAAGPSDEIDVLELSQNRASAIRDQLSIFANRDVIVARGIGAENPLDTSGTPAARARNQRTEFMVRERKN